MLLLAIEIAFVVVVAVGVGMIYLPAGLIAFGLFGVLACEYTATRQRLRAAAQAPTERMP